MALLHVWRPSVVELAATGDYDNVRQQDFGGSGAAETWMAAGGRFGEGTLSDDSSSTNHASFDLNGGQRDIVTGPIHICTSFYFEGGITGGEMDPVVAIGNNTIVTVGVLATELRLHNNGSWFIKNNNNQKYGADAGLTSQECNFRRNAWNTLAWSITPDNTNGILTMIINGITVMNAKNVGNTSTLANYHWVNFFGATLSQKVGATGGFRYGDTIIMDSAGSEFNAVIPDFRFEVDTSPTGDGTTTDWTSAGAGAAYVEIDDTEGTPDDDTTYIESTTAAQDSFVTYGGATLTNVNNIYGVLLGSYARDDAGSAPLQIAHRVDSSSTFATGTTYALTSSYELVWDGFEQDPNTSTDWTKTTIDAAEWGVQSIT